MHQQDRTNRQTFAWWRVTLIPIIDMYTESAPTEFALDKTFPSIQLNMLSLECFAQCRRAKQARAARGRTQLQK